MDGLPGDIVDEEEIVNLPVVVEKGTPGRKPLNLPQLLDPATGVLLPRYFREKAAGIRKEDGARKLRKLNHKHHAMIQLRLAGNSNETISMIMGCTAVTVSRIMNDPLTQTLMSDVYADRIQEIDNLTGKAIEGVRVALHSPNTDVKLRAVNSFLNMKKVLASETNPEATAEDIAQSILKNATVHGDVNVQVN